MNLTPLRIALVLVAAGTLGVVLGVAGTHHLIIGSAVDGPRLLERVSPSFSEFLVNSDALMQQPLLVVRAQHPLTLAALERDYYRREGHKRYSRQDYEKIKIGMTMPTVSGALGSLGREVQPKESRDGIVIDRYEYRNFLRGGFSVTYSSGRVIEKSDFLE